MEYQEFHFGENRLVIFVCVDEVTSVRYIPYNNVVRAFPNATQPYVDNFPVPFLADPNGILYEPRRLPFYPGRSIQLYRSGSSPFDSMSSKPTSDGLSAQQEYQREVLAQLEPMIGHSGRKQGAEDITALKKVKLHSLRTRLLLFTIIWGATMAAQLCGISSIVDDFVGESDMLKQRVAYWATACTILYGASLFFLAQWFTKDLVWHWHSNHIKQLWALQPSIGSFSIGLLHIRMPLMILFTLCLSLISVASMVTNFWLTSSARISIYTELSQPREITLMDAPLVTEDLSFTSTSGTIFNSFVAQSGASASGVVKLTPYNNRFFWSPFLNVTTPQTVAVSDIRTVSVAPSCTLLTAPMLNIPYNNSIPFGTDYQLNITSHQFVIDGVRGRSYYWGCQADTYGISNATDVPVGVIVYNVMVRTTPEFGPASFILSVGEQSSYVYATNCTVEMEWWNVTGTISSLEHQRLTIESATKTPAELRNAFFFQAVYAVGLSGFTTSQQGVFDNTGYSLKSPLWMWMMGRSYAMVNQSDPLSKGDIIHPNVTNAVWVESKLVEILGGTVTVNTGAVVPRKYIGQEVILTSVIHADQYRIIGCCAFLSLIVWVPILIYISKRKAGVYYGDDISKLLDSETKGVD